MNDMTSRVLRQIQRSTVLASGALVLTALLLQPSVSADAPKGEKPKPYPLPTCVVSGEKLAGAMGDPYVFAYQGREIKFCCKDCLRDFNKEPAKFVAKVDEAAKKVKPYPLATCLVSGEKFGGDMGDPYVFVYEGREIKLCCKDCVKDFNKEPAKFLKKLDEAQKNTKKGEKPGAPEQEHGAHNH
jgi:YHS domain-containing protein